MVQYVVFFRDVYLLIHMEGGVPTPADILPVLKRGDADFFFEDTGEIRDIHIAAVVDDILYLLVCFSQLLFDIRHAQLLDVGNKVLSRFLLEKLADV